MNNLNNVSNPSIIVTNAILLFNTISFNFFTIIMLNGTDNNAPNNNGNVNDQSMIVPTKANIITPTKQVNPSLKDVIPIELLVSTPDNTCPDVTTGPYPPPLIPLLNDATNPRSIIFLYEKAYVLFRVNNTSTPIDNTINPMYNFM